MILLPKPGPEASILSNGTTIHPHKKAERQKSFLTSSLSYTNQSWSFTKPYLFYIYIYFLYIYIYLYIFIYYLYLNFYIILFFYLYFLLSRFIFFNLSIFFPSLLPPERKIHNLLLWLFHFLSWVKALTDLPIPLSLSPIHSPYSIRVTPNAYSVSWSHYHHLSSLPCCFGWPASSYNGLSLAHLPWRMGSFWAPVTMALFPSCIWAIFLPTIVSVFLNH